MHHLFGLVLAQKDLSRAGDLFSLEDAEIEGSLSEALEQIRIISSSADYQSNDNDQAVVEICVTRITTAIRETASIDKHGKALVALWESCLEHNLKPSGEDEDTPHAKIASDITSCILQNYNRPPVMALAVPVAVKFLQRGNKELCRNMSSYLSLAAIAEADLLAAHTDTIVKSILQGNAMLLRVLPALYEKQPQPIDLHLRELAALLAQLDHAEHHHHLLRLLQIVARNKQLGVLKECIPFLFAHVRDPNHSDIILNILVEISSYEPAALATSLPALKEIGESFPSLIGQTAKIFGAVGRIDEEQARICLTYLVNQLANMEHSFHHILLLEIKSLTDTFSSILGSQSRDIYRMSNSFTAIAKLLVRQLESDSPSGARVEKDTETESPLPPDDVKSVRNGNEGAEKLQVKIQAFEEKIAADSSPPGSARRYSLGQVSREERKEMRFNRSKSLALHAVRLKGVNPESGQDEENGEITTGISFSEIYLGQENERLPFSVGAEATPLGNPLVSQLRIDHPESASSPESPREKAPEGSAEAATSPVEYQDKLYLHLKENLSKVKAYVSELGRKIPIPDQCVIEDAVSSCVAKLFFSCPLKGHYCLYSKSSFTLVSRQPPLWIHIMFLFQQSLLAEPLSIQSNSVQVLKALWEKTQLKGTRSFETAMIQSTFPHQKDLDHVQMHLEEVRFFDLFGYSEEAGAWQCFMCNNPEKATEGAGETNTRTHTVGRIVAWLRMYQQQVPGNEPGLAPGDQWLLGQNMYSETNIPGSGHKYYLQFTTEDYQSGEDAGSCLATVQYPKTKAPPVVTIKCSNTKDQKQIQEEDQRLYEKLKHQTKPITGTDIPDSYGNIAPALEPAWALAVAGSSYIMWEKSTENVGYFLAQVKSAKQWLRKDDLIEFDYTVLLHELPTQEVFPCHMRLTWRPHRSPKVKYFCASEHQGLEDGSGAESGSAAGVLQETGANF